MTPGRVESAAFLKALHLCTLLALLLAAGSCAHVSLEAVDLSQRMGQDLAVAHLANRELARSYYGTFRAQVDALVDTKYRPYVLETAIESTGLLQQLDAARRPGSELDALMQKAGLPAYFREEFASVADGRPQSTACLHSAAEH